MAKIDPDKSRSELFERTLYRAAEVDRSGDAIDLEKRTARLSFSSELPVDRGGWDEILDHAPQNADFSLLNQGAPALVNHDRDDQVGVVESATIGPDKKGRAVVRFSQSARGKEIFQDIADGIRRLVSVGYRLTQELSSEKRNGREVVRFAWKALEISTVPIPADSTVGVGRADNNLSKKETPMSDQTNTAPAPAAAPSDQHRTDRGTISATSEIEAIAQILEKRGVKGIPELASRALVSNMSVDAFRAEAMKLLPTVQPVRQAEPLDVKPKDWAKYSITRALRMQMPGEKRDGIEEELNQEISLKGGLRSSGVWVPREAFAMHSVQGRNFVAGTGTLGGMLVQTDNLGSQFIELLRNRAKTAMLGAKMINLSNPVTIPRQNGAGSVNWVGETVAATLSTGNFTQMTLTPNGLSAFQQYGKQLLFESDPSIDALIREDIMQIIALEIDRVVLHGSGSGQPTGITGTTGVTTIALGANGAAFSVANGRASMVSLETAIASSNADVANMAYLTNARLRGRLKMIDQSAATNTAQWVWQGGQAGEVNGYRAEVSNQVSAIQTQGTATTICSSVFFGNWSEVLVAQFNNGATDLVVDPYTLAANAVVRVIARHWVDIGIRHGQSFSVLLGALDS